MGSYTKARTQGFQPADSTKERLSPMCPKVAVGTPRPPSENKCVLGSLDHFDAAALVVYACGKVVMRGCERCLLAHFAGSAFEEAVVKGWAWRRGAGGTTTCFGGMTGSEREEKDARPCTEYILGRDQTQTTWFFGGEVHTGCVAKARKSIVPATGRELPVTRRSA